jgi:endonuclease/exonuclease/phosphatase family metal-dependent hydrolase
MVRPAAELRLAQRLVLFFSLFPFAVTGGCAHEHGLVHHPDGSTSQPAVQWFEPGDAKDEAPLARWRSAVGPPVIQQGENPSDTPADELTVVSWNTAVGAGDLRRFVASLRRSAPLVLLLQEVYRGGEEVPGVLPPGAAYAGRLGGRPGDSRYEQIEPIARALGLSLFYVPSMRNGGPESREDRGNAILSSLPLSDLAAYELPFERQRRVALAATISGTTTAGTPWRLHIVDAHLDNTFSPRRLWLASEYGRTRQARSLVATLDTGEPLILGGDFNTWSGFSDQAYLALARQFPAVAPSDRRPTFRGLLRLDHLFFRLEPGWSATFRRADDRFRSDHYPLVGTVRFQR